MLSLFNRWLALRPASLNRTLYTRPAKFIELSPRGSLIESKVDITMGDPHEAFILLPKDVGHAFRGAISRDGSLLVRDEDVCPLIFHHETRHFANESSPYPQLKIPQDLPCQSNTTASPATLYLLPATHTIALDGTRDAQYTRDLLNSTRKFKDDLDKLKDK
ncbi:hypothetical protein CISG_00368 [Coccidioides immitis RMSCC 3703]|uniref:Uncharacterized protein n=2 Tax=Coccidioides immitis TaxID=5501 RepID=A0A0J8QI76_COCIT|nr:hypothetical protein CIRG_07172 [Coccidioides immitis RMSCC 2394]KMU72059.1 hypothetical protein CISG_00368 [Coccidioides immitis RMSCC 3703]